MIKHIILILPFFLFNISIAQENEILAEKINVALSEEKLTGAVWSTINDEIITTGAVGLKNVDTNEILEDNDRVLIGSITKTLIATGILRLASQGVLEIDSPVCNLIPDIVFDNPWSEDNPVTIRDLLNHTSGIEDSRLWQVFSTESTPDTALSYVFSKNPSILKVRNIPGTRFSYSNIGYCFLGLIIEKVTHESYEKYLDKNLLIPLGMKQSTFAFVTQSLEYSSKDVAMGHFDNGTTQKNIPTFLRPAGQFTTTAKDMALFAKFLMGDGKIDGVDFIDKTLLHQMGSPTSIESHKNGLKSGYQFGLSYRDRYGVIGKFHRGNIIGYRAVFYLFPEQKKAFFISFNADSETADYEKFNTIFINHLAINKPKKIRTSHHLPPNIEDFNGYYIMNPVRFEMFAYLDLLFNSIQVTLEDDKIIIKSIQREDYSLFPVGGNLFRRKDRVQASHVFYRKDNIPVFSDGLITYEKATFNLTIMWLSFVLGLVGFVIIVFRGVYLLLKKRLFSHHQIILFPLIAIVGLLLPFPFLLNQSFLRLGEFTFANVLLAVVTGFLPIAMILGIRKMYKKTQTIDVIGPLFVLQWAVVLIYWGVIPFRLWH